MNATLLTTAITTALCISSGLGAQVLTQGTSIPAPGTIESHSHHFSGTPGVLATSGTGNTWDATGVINSGTSNLSTYHLAGDSPYAADHPTATLCAFVTGDLPDTWWHWNVTPSLAEFVGFDGAPYDDPHTICTFPFDLDSSFTDSHQEPGGSATSETMEYVASGEIIAPWGTIPDVVMFSRNGGLVYVFHSAGNVLAALGTYAPGFSLSLDQVVIFSGINEHVVPAINVWPVPASGTAHLDTRLDGAYNISLLDPAGRSIRSLTAGTPRLDLDLDGLAPGSYTVVAEGPSHGRRSGRVVIQ